MYGASAAVANADCIQWHHGLAPHRGVPPAGVLPGHLNLSNARPACIACPALPPCPAQNITLPLTGDDAAIKKYAADVEALKKQIGMPDVEDVSRPGCCWPCRCPLPSLSGIIRFACCTCCAAGLAACASIQCLTTQRHPCPAPCCPAPLQVISAELDYKFACSGYDVRSFVGAALESMSLGGGLEAAKAELLAAVDEAERTSGAELGGGNDKGWQVQASAAGEWAAAGGLLLVYACRQLGGRGT